jgi:UPF0716 family protein affecting phage T7 exclusion
MDKLIVFVILALSFNGAFMLQVFAQNVTIPEQEVKEVKEDSAEAVVNSYTALITAVGTLVGTIGSIIGVAVVFIRNKQTKAIAEQVGLGMVTFGQKTVENTDRIRNLTRAGYELSPEEAKTFLKQNQQGADQLTESVRKGTEQLQIIKENLPQPTAQKIETLKKTLPHEGFNTEPTV